MRLHSLLLASMIGASLGGKDTFFLNDDDVNGSCTPEGSLYHNKFSLCFKTGGRSVWTDDVTSNSPYLGYANKAGDSFAIICGHTHDAELTMDGITLFVAGYTNAKGIPCCTYLFGKPGQTKYQLVSSGEYCQGQSRQSYIWPAKA
ncbi:hypothetical protein BCV70DRAFT_201909 [Testicularia cyperi]|uniref:Uncharacterized protein n=1 Tax=Testicularia cyperi TaxID=1882483 RepID=A0A317XLA5_9BASI|nr:hypothetical protein BCV70DRAFT_201909 [Testicularia cyperi]